MERRREESRRCEIPRWTSLGREDCWWSTHCSSADGAVPQWSLRSSREHPPRQKGAGGRVTGGPTAHTSCERERGVGWEHVGCERCLCEDLRLLHQQMHCEESWILFVLLAVSLRCVVFACAAARPCSVLRQAPLPRVHHRAHHGTTHTSSSIQARQHRINHRAAPSATIPA